MQPLATTRRIMIWHSMCPAHKSTTPRYKWIYIAHALTILILNVIGFISSLTYCLKFVSIDFNSATFAFMLTNAEFGAIYFMISGILMRHRIGSIFTNLSAIYKSSK